VFCVLPFNSTKSVATDQREFRRKFEKEPPTANSIRKWYKHLWTRPNENECGNNWSCSAGISGKSKEVNTSGELQVECTTAKCVENSSKTPCSPALPTASVATHNTKRQGGTERIVLLDFIHCLVSQKNWGIKIYIHKKSQYTRPKFTQGSITNHRATYLGAHTT
jgi:hypothetical protein